MSIILHNRDIRALLSDRELASSLHVLGRVWASMAPFYPEGDLAGTPVLFSPSVRKMCCSQVGRDVLRQPTVVRRYASRVIRIMRAQKVPPFPGIARDVLAHLHVETIRGHSTGDSASTRETGGGGQRWKPL